MKYFYDTEFYDTGTQVHLLSIGIFAEDGRTLHLVDADAPWDQARADGWIAANVMPDINALPTDAWLPRAELRTAVRDFLRSPMHTGETELWAWFGGYDHVLLMQLLSHDGKMMNAPHHVPHWTNDVQQKRWEKGNLVLPPQTNGHHNALEDAKHVAFLWRYLESL